MNESEFLAHQIRVFLDQGNYDNEQLQNVTALMDSICRPGDSDSSYAISSAIDVGKYTNGNGSTSAKQYRCNAIDEALDSMYPVFRRAALNSSEKLDFSTIQFFPNKSEPMSYNLTDLINTSWIRSEMILESVCNITEPVKEYVRMRTSNSTAQDRLQQQRATSSSIMEFIDRVLDPIFGSLKRLSWEGSNRAEQIMAMLSHGFGSVRDGVGRGLSSTGKQVANLFSFMSTNSTAGRFNATLLSPFNLTGSSARATMMAINPSTPMPRVSPTPTSATTPKSPWLAAARR